MIERVIPGFAGATLAVYGAIAAFLLICTRRPALVPAGVLPCALAFSCAGAARLVGTLQYGNDGPSQPLVGAIELGLAFVCALFNIRRRVATNTG